MLHALYAQSRIWFLNEKRATRNLVAFEGDMGKFERRLVRISQLPDDAVAETRVLLAEIKMIS